jgi:3-isopropylmalate dehydrogenase
MQLIKEPGRFDVIVTENMFGDILSDEASVITGSIGLLPSASLGSGPGLYEPIHGSAPDIAGQNIANPIAIFSSIALMLRYSFGLQQEAQDLEKAISTVLQEGYRTRDIAKINENAISTAQMGEAIRTLLQVNQIDNEIMYFYERSR